MGPSATDLGSPGPHRPHTGHKSGHTQRMDGGLALSSVGLTGSPMRVSLPGPQTMDRGARWLQSMGLQNKRKLVCMLVERILTS